MPSARITRVETENVQGANVSLFDPFSDGLKLTMFFTLSADILQIPDVQLQGSFQILDFRNDQVVVHQSIWANYNPSLGPNLFWWLGSPTPHDWGLQWQSADIFGFRAAVEVFAQEGEAGMVAVDAFDVSDIRWFRLKDIFEL